MEELSELILEKLNTLVIVVNDQGSVDYVSSSSLKILGFESKQLLGDAWWNLTRNSEEETEIVKNITRKMFSQCQKGLYPQPYERLLKTSSGKNKWILWNTTVGPSNTMVAIGYDITDRKTSEQKLLKANVSLAQHNAEMLESINYAKRIQQSILPAKCKIEQLFNGGFVLYKPKDIVSGDFYWFYEKPDAYYIAAIDCTGHGVPGALLSVLAHSLLKKVIEGSNLCEPAQILYELDLELHRELNSGKEFMASDGMDISLCKILKDKSKAVFSGAFRPMIMIREGCITEFKGNRNPIGFYGGAEKLFEQTEIDLCANDTFYMFSDGYIDQFGGEKLKKLNRRRFKELLLTMETMDMSEQEAFLEYSINNWKQDCEQTDDIVVIGIRI
ncbi:MAG: SpoIIE family protein phosphatase [Bacteroidia bacterium]|nr:SpoIIE family protein phosphatase [Bacteroidia bacterium]